MATCARKEIIREGVPGIFHCWSRCVRRAWLQGNDPVSGKNFDHRRDWILERLWLLVSSFAVDVGFHAIMSNHLHLVLRALPRLVQRWGDYEVARRWLRVYPGRRVLDGKWIEPTEEQVQKLAEDKDQLAKIRKRLGSVSYFMAALKEYIARRANGEDNCRGTFFESRFSAREILSEASLLICGLYVDLNQVRAGEVATPEKSMRSSIGLRVQAQFVDDSTPSCDAWLAPLTLSASDLGDVPSTTGHRASDKGLLSVTLTDYLRLLDYAGREIVAGKSGAIPADLAPILERLGLQTNDRFIEAVKNFPRLFRRFAGNVANLQARASAMKRQWVHGVLAAKQIFAPTPPTPP